jgi:hypothetical protein
MMRFVYRKNRDHTAIWTLLWLFQWTKYVYSNYLTTPEFAWSVPIITTSTAGNDVDIFQKGNAIVPINDKGLLAITSSTGVLHIVASNRVVVNNATGVVTNTTDIKKSYVPNMVSNNLDTTTCQGGIITSFLSRSGNTESYIVLYAVTGSDSTSQLPPLSRILAINSSSAALVWNVTIPGTIIGTPVVSSSKDRMYVVHNIVSGQVGTSSSDGRVSIYKFNTNGDIFTSGNRGIPTLVTTLPTASTGRPFAPASLSTNPIDGKDYLFFAQGSDDGVFSNTFLSDSLFAITESNGMFTFSIASKSISSTNTAPTTRNNNDEILELFLGQPESTLFGWIDDDAVTLLAGLSDGNGSSSSFGFPSWRLQTDQNNQNSATRMYILFTITLFYGEHLD